MVEGHLVHGAWITSLGSRVRGLEDLSRSVSGVEQRGRSRSIMSWLHGDLVGVCIAEQWRA